MKPILFNAQMVRAILDGRKTQTRRFIKLWNNHSVLRGGTFPGALDGAKYGVELDTHGVLVAPYQKGDILWVRETWTSENGAFYYRADFASDFLDPCETLVGGYPGDCAYHPGCEGCARGPKRIRWRPSIHMPKEAARIFLRVTDVRVERLWDICSEDVYAEGTDNRLWAATRDAFRRLWDSTIKKADADRYGWAANPWVWVYTFKRCGKEGESWNG